MFSASGYPTSQSYLYVCIRCPPRIWRVSNQSSLKRNFRHVDEFFVTGIIGSSYPDNFWRSQCSQVRHRGDLLVSMLISRQVLLSDRYAPKTVGKAKIEAHGLGIETSLSHVPLCILRTKPSRIGFNPINFVCRLRGALYANIGSIQM